MHQRFTKANRGYNVKVIEEIYHRISSRIEKSTETKFQSGLKYPGIERDVTVVKSLKLAGKPPLDFIEVNVTTPEARPHFEWLAEVTLDYGGSDYHRYLIRDHYELVAVRRKEITQLSDDETKRIVNVIGQNL